MGPIVEFFVREAVVAFEVDGQGDVVGCGGGCHFSPEQQLVGVGQLGETDKPEFQLESA